MNGTIERLILECKYKLESKEKPTVNCDWLLEDLKQIKKDYEALEEQNKKLRESFNEWNKSIVAILENAKE